MVKSYLVIGTCPEGQFGVLYDRKYFFHEFFHCNSLSSMAQQIHHFIHSSHTCMMCQIMNVGLAPWEACFLCVELYKLSGVHVCVVYVQFEIGYSWAQLERHLLAGGLMFGIEEQKTAFEPLWNDLDNFHEVHVPVFKEEHTCQLDAHLEQLVPDELSLIHSNIKVDSKLVFFHDFLLSTDSSNQQYRQ